MAARDEAIQSSYRADDDEAPTVMASGGTNAAEVEPGPIQHASNENPENQKSFQDGENRKCVVCHDTAKGIYFGALVCLPCKSFFIRCTKDGVPTFACQGSGNCDITQINRLRCQACRYTACCVAGMSRKEKPEQVRPLEGQELCRVCSDIANGIHFGILTCEGCKKFFRRGLKECDTYECKFSKECGINPRNRNACRYCRYQKCLQVGMSREAIKMGRPKKNEGKKNDLTKRSSSSKEKHQNKETGIVTKPDSNLFSAAAIVPSSPTTTTTNSISTITTKITTIDTNCLKTLQVSDLECNQAQGPFQKPRSPVSKTYGSSTSKEAVSTSRARSPCSFQPSSSFGAEEKLLDNATTSPVSSTFRATGKATSSTARHRHSMSEYPESNAFSKGYPTQRKIQANIRDRFPSTEGFAAFIERYQQDQSQDRELPSTLSCENLGNFAVSTSQAYSTQEAPASTSRESDVSWYPSQSILPLTSPEKYLEQRTEFTSGMRRGETLIQARDPQGSGLPQQIPSSPLKASATSASGDQHSNIFTSSSSDQNHSISSRSYSSGQSLNTGDSNTFSMHDLNDPLSTPLPEIIPSADEKLDKNYSSSLGTSSNPVCIDELSEISVSEMDSLLDSLNDPDPQYDTWQGNSKRIKREPEDTLPSCALSSSGYNISDPASSSQSIQQQQVLQPVETRAQAREEAPHDSTHDTSQWYTSYDNYLNIPQILHLNRLFMGITTTDVTPEDTDDTNLENPLLWTDFPFEESDNPLAAFPPSDVSSYPTTAPSQSKSEWQTPSFSTMFDTRQMHWAKPGGTPTWLRNVKVSLRPTGVETCINSEYWLKPLYVDVTLPFSREENRLKEYLVTNLVECLNAIDENYQLPPNRQAINKMPWPGVGHQKPHWSHVGNRIMRNTSAVAKYAMGIPGFLQLPREDISEILRDSSFQMITLMCATKYYDKQNHKFKFIWNWRFTPNNPMYMFQTELWQLGEHLYDLNLDDTELALLCAQIFIAGDFIKLEKHDEVENMRNILVSILKRYTWGTYQQNPYRAEQLLAHMPKIRQIGIWHTKLISHIYGFHQIQLVDLFNQMRLSGTTS